MDKTQQGFSVFGPHAKIASVRQVDHWQVSFGKFSSSYSNWHPAYWLCYICLLYLNFENVRENREQHISIFKTLSENSMYSILYTQIIFSINCKNSWMYILSGDPHDFCHKSRALVFKFIDRKLLRHSMVWVVVVLVVWKFNLFLKYLLEWERNVSV